MAAALDRVENDLSLATKFSVPLLVRSRLGVTPTPAGEILVRHARILLAQMNEMMDDLARHGAGLRATVRLHGNSAAACEHLPHLLATWMAANPATDVKLHEARSYDIADALRDGRADLGVLSDEVETTGLSVQPLFADCLVVVAHPGHALANNVEVEFASLLDESFIGSNGPLQGHVDAQAIRLGARLRHRVQVGGYEDVCRLVAAGVGIGVLSRATIDRLAGSFPIIWRQLSDGWATRRLCLCASKDRPMTKPSQRLMQYLTKSARSLVKDGELH